MHKNKVRDKQQLRRGVNISIKTAMVGAIASFEEKFGELWGHNKEGPLTEDEQEWLELWQDVRTEIFDKGNRCIQIANNHLDRFCVEEQVTYFSGNSLNDSRRTRK